MPRFDEIKRMTIEELGLSRQVTEDLVLSTLRYRDRHAQREIESSTSKVQAVMVAEYANKLTVGDIIAHGDAYMAYLEEADGRPTTSHMKNIGLGEPSLCRKLIELGVTQLDWIRMPSETVTDEMLRVLGKEEVKKLSILVLGTFCVSTLLGKFDVSALNILEGHFHKRTWRITIGEILTLGKQWAWHQSCAKEMAGTRERLLEIGFESADGPLMQYTPLPVRHRPPIFDEI